jgi:hypothetical protein
VTVVVTYIIAENGVGVDGIPAAPTGAELLELQRVSDEFYLHLMRYGFETFLSLDALDFTASEAPDVGWKTSRLHAIEYSVPPTPDEVDAVLNSAGFGTFVNEKVILIGPNFAFCTRVYVEFILNFLAAYFSH